MKADGFSLIIHVFLGRFYSFGPLPKQCIRLKNRVSSMLSFNLITKTAYNMRTMDIIGKLNVTITNVKLISHVFMFLKKFKPLMGSACIIISQRKIFKSPWSEIMNCVIRRMFWFIFHFHFTCLLLFSINWVPNLRIHLLRRLLHPSH